MGRGPISSYSISADTGTWFDATISTSCVATLMALLNSYIQELQTAQNKKLVISIDVNTLSI